MTRGSSLPWSRSSISWLMRSRASVHIIVAAKNQERKRHLNSRKSTGQLARQTGVYRPVSQRFPVVYSRKPGHRPGVPGNALPSRAFSESLPSTTKALLTKNYSEIIRESLSFPAEFEGAKFLRKPPKNNSQGIIFVIISCRRVCAGKGHPWTNTSVEGNFRRTFRTIGPYEFPQEKVWTNDWSI